jgi:hypothetical protein
MQKKAFKEVYMDAKAERILNQLRAKDDRQSKVSYLQPYT